MAELPSKVHLTSHPICLDIRGPTVYEDEKKRTWVHLVMGTGAVLQVKLIQVDYPSVHNAPTTSQLSSSTMPSWWVLHLGIKYLDSMGRFWRILHHVKENSVEEMILERIEDV